jgi:hypothetical protein
MTPPLVNAMVMNTVMFSVFRYVKQSLPDGTAGALTAGVISGGDHVPQHTDRLCQDPIAAPWD